MTTKECIEQYATGARAVCYYPKEGAGPLIVKLTGQTENRVRQGETERRVYVSGMFRGSFRVYAVSPTKLTPLS